MKACVGFVNPAFHCGTMPAAACACARISSLMDTAVILAVSIFVPIISIRLRHWRA